MTDEVAADVLRDNYEQNVLLGNARAQQYSMLPVHQRLIHWLEERGELNRALEYLPSDAEIAKRRADKLGLTSPEFSVLVAYAKLALKADLMPTALADDPWFQQTLSEYFPERCATSMPTQLAAHPLRREIIINAVVNSMVNRGGITFAFRAGEETGADTGAGRPGVRRVPRGVRADVLRRRDRGPRQRRVDADADDPLPRVPAAARPGVPLVPLDPAHQHRRRRRGRSGSADR